MRSIPTQDDKLYYLSCGNNNCRKKVTPYEANAYNCEVCSRKITDPVPLYTFTVKIEDKTGTIFAQVYKDVGEKILGVSAQQIRDIVENSKLEEKEERIREIKKNCRFKVKSFL